MNADSFYSTVQCTNLTVTTSSSLSDASKGLLDHLLTCSEQYVPAHQSLDSLATPQYSWARGALAYSACPSWILLRSRNLRWSYPAHVRLDDDRGRTQSLWIAAGDLVWTIGCRLGSLGASLHWERPFQSHRYPTVSLWIPWEPSGTRILCGQDLHPMVGVKLVHSSARNQGYSQVRPEAACEAMASITHNLSPSWEETADWHVSACPRLIIGASHVIVGHESAVSLQLLCSAQRHWKCLPDAILPLTGKVQLGFSASLRVVVSRRPHGDP